MLLLLQQISFNFVDKQGVPANELAKKITSWSITSFGYVMVSNTICYSKWKNEEFKMLKILRRGVKHCFEDFQNHDYGQFINELYN